MTKELQDLTWSVLPKEFKKEVKRQYQIAIDSKVYNTKYTLDYLFGIHNLTSDAEEEEILMAKANVVKDLYNSLNKTHPKEHAWVVKQTLETLFGSKFLLYKKECSNPSVVNCKHKHGDGTCSLGNMCCYKSPNLQEPKFGVEDKITFAGDTYNIRNIIDKRNGEFDYNLDCIPPRECSESKLTLCTNNFCQIEGQVIDHEGIQTFASTEDSILDIEPNIFNIKPDNSDILNYALIKLEEASKAVKEALTKVNKQ